MDERKRPRTIRSFWKQGHSGFSAYICVDLFEKLAKHKNIMPLTGEDSEWVDVAEYNSGNTLYQNNRLSSVFKDNTDCWDIDGIVFYDILPNGFKSHFTNIKSRVPVKFPYIQKQKYKFRWSFENVKNYIVSKIMNLYEKANPNNSISEKI